MDIALSISHDPNTGVTCALLLGCSDSQVAFILHQLRILASLASHPLLLPTLISTYIRTFLGNYSDDIATRLLRLEMESGQTGVLSYDEHGLWPLGQRNDYAALTSEVLGVIQLAVTWENYAKGLLFNIKSIQECISYINLATPSPRKETVEAKSAILDERLRFLSHKGNITLWRLQFVAQRTQAQMTAVCFSPNPPI